MKIKYAEKWVKALRSGKYKQGTKYLCYSGKYCCLGVLDDIFPKMKLTHDEMTGETSSRSLPGYDKIGLENRDGKLPTGMDYYVSLTQLNDGKDNVKSFNFDEIADIIQAIYVEKVL